MNKILLIFYGGTGLFDKKGSFVFVEKDKDVNNWIKLVPELSLMAEVETLVIKKEKDFLNKNIIVNLINSIQEKINQVDGIIILHEVDTIPLLANQLFWQIQNPEKPIVITGSNVIEQESEFLPDLSFKANLINAFQVVNSGLRAISVIYGNRVISAPKVLRTKLHDLNIFDSVDKKYLAKIDFGLSIETKDKKQGQVKYFSKFDYDFLFFKMVPKIKFLEKLLSKDSSVKVVIFQALPNQMMARNELVKVFNLCQENKKLAILYNQIGFGKDFKHTILTISGITPECLSAKLAWILGQTKNQNKIRDMLKEDIQREFF